MFFAILFLKAQHASEQVKDYSNMESMHENVSYFLWELNGMKVIVRLSIDGYVNSESSSLNVNDKINVGGLSRTRRVLDRWLF